MIIKDFVPFIGKHCETTATGSLLKQMGIELSEPMLFGIGQGLGYIFWNMKVMDFPFIGGRVKTDVLTENICRNLGLTLNVQETSSVKKAWENVKTHIDQGKAVGLKLDCYHLEYFTTKIHFAGHYASIYGYDQETAYLNDTDQQGRAANTSLKSLALARNEKGPMSSKNRSYTITGTGQLSDLPAIIKRAIHANATEFLNPPITNMGYKGIYRTSSEIRKWFKTSTDLKRDFQTTASLMERGGTGGSLFRKIYAEFLEECASIIGSEALLQASRDYQLIASGWKEVSDLFMQIGETGIQQYVDLASSELINLSEKEKVAMQALLQHCAEIE